MLKLMELVVTELCRLWCWAPLSSGREEIRVGSVNEVDGCSVCVGGVVTFLGS